MGLSHQGQLYFRSCTLLAAVMQIYYELNFYEDDKVWVQEYEHLMEWLADETLFPLNYEQVSEEASLELQRLSELEGDEAFTTVFNHIHASLLGVGDRQPALDQKRQAYYLFSETALYILEKFSEIVSSPTMMGTTYHEHYQAGTELINQLKAKIKAILQKFTQLSDETRNLSSIIAHKNGIWWQDQVITK